MKKHPIAPPERKLKRNARGTTSLPNTEGRKKAQKKYNSKPEQIKRRAARNAARRKLEKQGKVRKGDGKDIDHKDHNPHNNSDSNLQVQDKRTNRKDGGPKRGSKRKK